MRAFIVIMNQKTMNLYRGQNQSLMNMRYYAVCVTRRCPLKPIWRQITVHIAALPSIQDVRHIILCTLMFNKVRLYSYITYILIKPGRKYFHFPTRFLITVFPQLKTAII